MTDSNEENGGLPTAAIVDNPNSAKYEHCLKIPVASKEMSKDVLEWGDELVRRTDVNSIANQTDFYLQSIAEALERGDDLEEIKKAVKAAKSKNAELLEELEQ